MPETVAPKPGRHREASLYHALHGAGAGLAGREGRSPEAIREAAQLVFEASELPVWRRSGFWTTSLQELDLDELEVRSHAPGALPELVRAGLPERGGLGAGVAGRIVQLDGSVVHVELDPALAERGVVLCSLEEALRNGDERAREHFSKRLTYDRHKLEAANAAFWTGGAYLYVPPGVTVAEPFEIVYAIEDAGVAQYGRSLVVGDRASEFRVHEHELAGSFAGQSLHAGAFELYLHDGARCRLAQVQDWSAGEVYDVFDALRRRRSRCVLPLAAVTARWAAGAPAPRAGGVRARRRHGLSRPVLQRGSGASRHVRGGPARDGAVGWGRALARRGNR